MLNKSNINERTEIVPVNAKPETVERVNIETVIIYDTVNEKFLMCTVHDVDSRDPTRSIPTYNGIRKAFKWVDFIDLNGSYQKFDWTTLLEQKLPANYSYPTGTQAFRDETQHRVQQLIAEGRGDEIVVAPIAEFIHRQQTMTYYQTGWGTKRSEFEDAVQQEVVTNEHTFRQILWDFAITVNKIFDEYNGHEDDYYLEEVKAWRDFADKQTGADKLLEILGL